MVRIVISLDSENLLFHCLYGNQKEYWVPEATCILTVISNAPGSKLVLSDNKHVRTPTLLMLSVTTLSCASWEWESDRAFEANLVSAICYRDEGSQ